MSATCTSCHQAIVWSITEATGRRMPLDPELVPYGNVLIVDRDPRGTPIVKVLGNNIPAPEGGAYVSHFSTCPHRDAHRRRHRA